MNPLAELRSIQDAASKAWEDTHSGAGVAFVYTVRIARLIAMLEKASTKPENGSR